MKRKFGIVAALFAASLTLTSGAQANDSLLGALLGAGAGVVVGQAIGGRDGAIVGGGIGAIAGAAIASERDRSHEVYAPAHRSRYYDEPVVVERRPIRLAEHRHDWHDRSYRDERRWIDRHREERRWNDRWDRDDRHWQGWRERRAERRWQDD